MNRALRFALSSLAAGFGGIVLAADPPQPGQIFQQQQQPAAPRLPDPGPADDKPDFSPLQRQQPTQAPGVTSATRRIAVKAFRVTGLTVAPESAAQAVLAKHRGRESTVTDLHEAATDLQEYLRTLGYFARVYVPTQDVKDGVVELRVVESRINAISVQRGEGLRIDDETLKRYFAAGGEAEGALLQQSKLERDLLLVNELAGVKARAVLVPGKDPGTTTLLLSATAEPFVQGFVSADNAGNKFTGRERADVDMRMNSPLGVGDQLAVRGSVTRYSNFARAAYTLPVTATGLAIGAAYAFNDYKLCCEFAPLDQNGWARSGNLFANYPLIRSLARNLSVSIVYTDRRIVGRALGALSSDHRVDSWTPGLFGDWQDKWGGLAARTNWAVQCSAGRVDLSTSPDQALDSTTARTAGSFSKTTFNMARVQKVGENWMLLASVRGQFASRNLDSSEKLILGGVSGVRAYPTGEAVGDSGVILNAEMQREILPQVVGGFFLDYGHIELHKTTWAGWEGGNPNVRNRYSLSGGGLSLTWLPNPRLVVRAMLATPFGSNPGRDAAGRNSENARDATRLWASLSLSF
jgi:hemolysin activation/secretion protein